ncbi:MAG: RimL [Herbinix sp.]|jgi:ribosomal-protein-alanine N-acetyltransferase|nr:RimL [Herbinix sp.]
MNFPIYENERYLMREMTTEDANDIFEYYSDRLLMKYTATPPHIRIADTVTMIRTLTSSYQNDKGIAWAIADKIAEKVIGNIGLYYVGTNKNKAAVGYNISTPYQNQGIATWALGNCLQFGLEYLHLKCIEAKCKSVNYASERVMQKCGMKLHEVNRSPFLVDGTYYDIKTYSLKSL